MNRKHIGWLLCIPAFLGMGLTSCSNEEPLAVKETAQEKLVDVKLTATISNSTRATLDPSANIIKFAWESSDIIKVVNGQNGQYLGELKVTKVLEDVRTCEFAGQISVSPGNYDLNFYYLGKDGELGMTLDADSKKLVATSVPVDFSNQNGKAEFAANDILIAQGTYSSDKVLAGNLGVLNFDRYFAYGRFILKYNGEELNVSDKTVTISANTGTLHNKTVLDPKTAKFTSTEGNISIINPSTGGFYVSFIPTEAVNLKFTVDMGADGLFVGTKGKELVSSTYYTADEAGAPIIVEMKHEDGSDDEQQFTLIYEPNYTPTSDLNKVYTKNRVGSADFTVQTYDLFTRDGYEIVGWNTETDGSGTPYEAGSTLTITWPNTTATLYAQWEKSVFDYTIIFEDGEGNPIASESFEAGSPYTISVKKYEHQALPGIPANMELEGWALKEAPKTIVTELTYDTEHTVYTVVPVYKEYTWKFQWVDDPTVGKEVYKTKLESGTTSPHTLGSVHPANPTKDGYKFLGWEYNGKMIASEKEVVATKDNLNPLIYAKWEKNPTTVTTPGYKPGTFN